RRRHTRFSRDWSSDVCSSDLQPAPNGQCHLVVVQRTVVTHHIVDDGAGFVQRRLGGLHLRVSLGNFRMVVQLDQIQDRGAGLPCCEFDGKHVIDVGDDVVEHLPQLDRKSTRLNSSHVKISYAVFCLKKKNNI